MNTITQRCWWLAVLLTGCAGVAAAGEPGGSTPAVTLAAGGLGVAELVLSLVFLTVGFLLLLMCIARVARGGRGRACGGGGDGGFIWWGDSTGWAGNDNGHDAGSCESGGGDS